MNNSRLGRGLGGLISGGTLKMDEKPETEVSVADESSPSSSNDDLSNVSQTLPSVSYTHLTLPTKA